MALPKRYLTSSEGAVASFNYLDIAEGTGVVIFYGATTNMGSGAEYILTTQTPYSSDTRTKLVNSGEVTMDFDLSPFNLPQAIRGTAYFQCTLGAANNIVCYAQAQIKKWDGTSETNITDVVQTETLTAVDPPAASRVQTMFVEMPTTDTHFANGDQLRLTVKLTQVNTTDGCEIGHDPKDRLDADTEWITVGSTQLVLYAPFRLDL